MRKRRASARWTLVPAKRSQAANTSADYSANMPVFIPRLKRSRDLLGGHQRLERLHRHFLEVVRLELDGIGMHDINNVQGLLLFNIGDAEMTVGELTLRGC